MVKGEMYQRIKELKTSGYAKLAIDRKLEIAN